MMQIPLRSESARVTHTQVDAVDYERFGRFVWWFDGDYVAREVALNGRRTKLYLHREIVSAPPGTVVDHKDLDKLNNQSSNLRLVTPTENAQNQPYQCRNNTSGHRGVSWDGVRERWAAYGKINRRKHFLGRYADLADAVHAATEWRNQTMPFSEN